MKFMFLVILMVLFYSCNKKNSSKENSSKKNDLKQLKFISRNPFLDRYKNGSMKVDTTSTSAEELPVEIIKAEIHKNEYSDHKNIHVIFKNSSTKSIKAIKFEWFCLNSFDKPASTHYFFIKGKFKEKHTALIQPGKTEEVIWEDFSTDANSISFIRAYLVVYVDGSKWEFSQD